jgi:hypothetical protein
MTGAEEPKGVILSKLWDKLEYVCEHGTPQSKLNEQRINMVENSLNDIKEGIRDIDRKLDSYFDKNESWKRIITILIIIMFFLLGGNVWEALRAVVLK